jgi:FkbM family methyltransferase
MIGSEVLIERQPAARSEINRWMAKYLAFVTLCRMIRWLANWRAVWRAYATRSSLPPLYFRRGFILHHTTLDDPVMLLQEVFARGAYSRKLLWPVSSGTIIDLGANIGVASLMWTTRHPRIRVHAYEPNPPTLQTLRRNIHDNGLDDQVTIHDEAVGRELGRLRLWSNVPSIQATGYGETPPQPDGIEIAVSMINLDEVVSRVPHGRIELLKMDVEGAEADVLEGASDSSLKRIKQVVLEYHGGLCPGAQSRCAEVLSRAGFRLRISPTDTINGLLYACRD